MSVETPCRVSPKQVLQSQNGHGNLPPPCDSRYAAWKAPIERFTALVILAAASPLILVLMALVRITSHGPALYRQVRVGLNGQLFTILKLRTMFCDSERETGPQLAQPGDPRVTPLGRFLRRTHLDELPQLWNVLRGDMSLVGPRPERPIFVRQLEKAFPHYRKRLLVKPGITGLAQIQLPADENFDGIGRKLAYDIYYVERMELWLDLRILIGTILKVACMRFRSIRRFAGLPTPETILGTPSSENEPDSPSVRPGAFCSLGSTSMN